MALGKITEQNISNVDKFLNEVIKPILPNAKFADASMWSAPDELATNFEGHMLPKGLLNDSVYEYKGDWKFLHFTNLFSLKTILESGFLRMSAFGNLIDNKEINYALDVFAQSQSPANPIDNAIIEELKEHLYCLSLCESNSKTRRDDYMWEVYADKGRGVAIEFEFTKPNPSQFLFGKMQYGDKELKPINDLKKLTEEFINENPNFFPNNFTELFVALFSFHKVKRYSIENEVRMLLYDKFWKYDKYKLESVYKDINNRYEVKNFNKLFLRNRHPFLDLNYPFSDEKDIVLDEFPQIEIKNIILGYGLSNEKQIALEDLLKDVKNDKNYDFKISKIFDEGIIRNMSYPHDFID